MRRLYNSDMLVNQYQTKKESYKPIVEAIFKKDFERLSEGVKSEKIDMIAHLYANKERVVGSNPVNADGKLFSKDSRQRNFFESIQDPYSEMKRAGYKKESDSYLGAMGHNNIANRSNPTFPGTAGPAGSGNASTDAGYSWGTGDGLSYVFGIQSQVVKETFALDIIPGIGVDTPQFSTRYVENYYTNGPLDGDSSDTLPGYIGLYSKAFGYNLHKDYKRFKTEIVIVAANKNYIKVLFVNGTTDKPGITVEVIETGVFNDVDTTYTKTATKSIVEILKNINDNGGKIGVNGGELVALGDDKIYVDHVSQTRNHISEAATNNNKLSGMTRAEHKKGPKHMLSVRMLEASWNIHGYEIDAASDELDKKDYAAVGVNVVSFMFGGIQNQIVQVIDDVVLEALYRAGCSHALNHYQTQNRHFNMFFDNSTVENIAIGDIPGLKNLVDWSENDLAEELSIDISNENYNLNGTWDGHASMVNKAIAKINVISEYIGQKTRIAKADFCVLSSSLGAAIKTDSKFTIFNSGFNQSKGGLALLGEIDGIKYYTRPGDEYFYDHKVLVGRRGNDSDEGIKLFAYDLVSVDSIIAEGTFSDRLRIRSRFRVAEIGFNPFNSYMTAVFYNKKGWA